MPTGWDSILTAILFGDWYVDGLEMLLAIIQNKTKNENFKHILLNSRYLIHF